MKPEVSVIIPVYNSIATIERSLASTLDQNVAIEVILIDDQSQDDSAQHIKYLIDQYPGNYRFLQTDKNLGASGARNLGIASATAEYVAFLDADDLWLPGKLQKQLKAMKADSSTVLVTCDSLKVTPLGEIKTLSHQNNVPVKGPDAWKTLLSYNFIPTPTVLTRTDLIKQANGFDLNLKIGEDLDLWIKIAKLGSVQIVNEVLVHYFDTAGSLMKQSYTENTKHILEVINRHINDDRLSEEERNKLLARRYFEIGKRKSLAGTAEMHNFFNKAIDLGYSSHEIRTLKFKRGIKKLTASISLKSQG